MGGTFSGQTSAPPSQTPSNTPSTSTKTPPPTTKRIAEHTVSLKSIPLYNTLAFLVPCFSADPHNEHLISLWRFRHHQFHARHLHHVLLPEPTDLRDPSEQRIARISPIIVSPLGTPVHPCYTNEEVQLMSAPLDPNNLAHKQALLNIPLGCLHSPSLAGDNAEAPIRNDEHYLEVCKLNTKFDNAVDLLAERQGLIQAAISPVTYQPIGGLTYQLTHYRSYAPTSWSEEYGASSGLLNTLFGEHKRIFHQYELDNNIDYRLEQQHDYNEHDYLPFDPEHNFTLFFDFAMKKFSGWGNVSWFQAYTSRQPTSIPFLLFFLDVISEKCINEVHHHLDQLVSFRQHGSLEISDSTPFVFVLKNTSMLDEALISEAHILDFCVNICHFTNVIFYHYDGHQSDHSPSKATEIQPEIQPSSSKNQPKDAFSVEKYQDDIKFVGFLDQLVLRVFCEQHAFSPTLSSEEKLQRYTNYGLTKTVYESDLPNSYGIFSQYGMLADNKVKYSYWPYFTLKKPLLSRFSPFVAVEQEAKKKQGGEHAELDAMLSSRVNNTPLINSEARLGSKSNPFQIKTDGFVFFSDHSAFKHSNLLQLFRYPTKPLTNTYSKREREAKGPYFQSVSPPTNQFFVSRRIFPPITHPSLLDSVLPQPLHSPPTTELSDHSKFISQELIQATTSPLHFQAFSQLSSTYISQTLFPQLQTSLEELKSTPNNDKSAFVTDYSQQTLPLSLPSTALHLPAPIQRNTQHSSLISPLEFDKLLHNKRLRAQEPGYDPEAVARVNRFRKDFPLSIYTAVRDVLASEQHSAEKVDFSYHNGARTAHQDPLTTQLQQLQVEEEVYRCSVSVKAGYISHRSSGHRDSNQIASALSQQPNNFSFGAFVVDLEGLIDVGNAAEPLSRVFDWEFSDGKPDVFSLFRAYNTDLCSLHYTPFTIWTIFILPPHLVSLDHIKTAYPHLYQALLRFSADLQSPTLVLDDAKSPFSQRATKQAGLLTVASYFVTPDQVPALWEYILRRSVIERLHLINSANHIGDFPDSVE